MAAYRRLVSTLYQQRKTQMFTRFLRGIAFAAISIFASISVFGTNSVFAASTHDLSTNQPTGKLVFERVLPNVPGKSIKVVLIEYPPGGSIPAHTHPDSSFIYATVLKGAIRSKRNDEPEKVYHVGDNFVEEPGDLHGVSKNESDTETASLLAVCVLDTDEKNLPNTSQNSK